MLKFYLQRSDGFVERAGICSQDQLEHQAVDGLTLIEGDVPLELVQPTKAHEWVDGAWQLNLDKDFDLQVVAVLAKRRREYKPVGDQLDVLYKAMRDGILPMVPEFYDSITKVKSDNPKPVKPIK